jgi:hypothetical protein
VKGDPYPNLYLPWSKYYSSLPFTLNVSFSQLTARKPSW